MNVNHLQNHTTSSYFRYFTLATQPHYYEKAHQKYGE